MIVARLLAFLFGSRKESDAAPEPEPIRFCCDCKYRKPDSGALSCSTDYDGCYAPQNAKADLVSGRQVRILKYCDTLRRHDMDGYCGPAGRWFKPIEKDVEK